MSYNQAYGIFDHLAQDKIDTSKTAAPDKKRPWAAIEVHNKEDITKFTRLRKMCTIFANNRIGDYFNIDIFQFLSSDEEMITMMIEISEKMIKDKNKRTENLFTDK